MVMVLVFGASVLAAEIEVDPETKEVRIPLVVDVTKSVAGAQLSFSYTDGLEFIAYEQSASVISGSQTPTVERDGLTHIGFFSGSNEYEPVDGKLDIGYLVFAYIEDGDQSVSITEIKLVSLNEDNTETLSEILENAAATISVVNGIATSTWIPPTLAAESQDAADPAAADDIETEDKNSGNWWIYVVVGVAAAAVVVVLYLRNKKGRDQVTEESSAK